MAEKKQIFELGMASEINAKDDAWLPISINNETKKINIGTLKQTIVNSIFENRDVLSSGRYKRYSVETPIEENNIANKEYVDVEIKNASKITEEEIELIKTSIKDNNTSIDNINKELEFKADIAEATSENPGLMSKYDKQNLEELIKYKNINKEPVLCSEQELTNIQKRTIQKNLNLVISPNYKYENKKIKKEILFKEIEEPNFGNLSTGNYIEISMPKKYSKNGTVKLILADFNTFFGVEKEDTTVCFSDKHICCVIDGLIEYSMNNSDTTENGYLGTNTFDFLEEVFELLNNELDGRLKKHNKLFSNNVKNGKSISYSCENSGISLLTETQVFGSTVFSSWVDVGEGYKQFSVFKNSSISEVLSVEDFFLRGVASDNSFCCVNNGCLPGIKPASEKSNIIPFIIFGGK